MASESMPVIVVEDVCKHYGSVRAVDGVSFEVGAGEVFGLLGPNGAGKTTTVEMLEGLRVPDSGRLSVLGLEVPRSVDALRPRIGVALQTPSLYPRLTVEEVVALFASFYRDPSSIDEVIVALDLGDRRKALTKDLSGGQKQRLSVALALVNDPELVFLDEPTTGMDPAARRSLWDLIRGLKANGRTVLLTTHYMEEAEELCDRVAIIDHGKVLEIGTVAELISRHFHERAVHFLRIDTIDDAELAALPGVVRVKHEDEDRTLLYTLDVAATIGGLLDATDRRGTEPRDLGIRKPSLEDVFLELTGRALRD